MRLLNGDDDLDAAAACGRGDRLGVRLGRPGGGSGRALKLVRLAALPLCHRCFVADVVAVLRRVVVVVLLQSMCSIRYL